MCARDVNVRPYRHGHDLPGLVHHEVSLPRRARTSDHRDQPCDAGWLQPTTRTPRKAIPTPVTIGENRCDTRNSESVARCYGPGRLSGPNSSVAPNAHASGMYGARNLAGSGSGRAASSVVRGVLPL